MLCSNKIDSILYSPFETKQPQDILCPLRKEAVEAYVMLPHSHLHSHTGALFISFIRLTTVNLPKC